MRRSYVLSNVESLLSITHAKRAQSLLPASEMRHNVSPHDRGFRQEGCTKLSASHAAAGARQQLSSAGRGRLAKLVPPTTQQVGGGLEEGRGVTPYHSLRPSSSPGHAGARSSSSTSGSSHHLLRSLSEGAQGASGPGEGRAGGWLARWYLWVWRCKPSQERRSEEVRSRARNLRANERRADGCQPREMMFKISEQLYFCCVAVAGERGREKGGD